MHADGGAAKTRSSGERQNAATPELQPDARLDHRGASLTPMLLGIAVAIVLAVVLWMSLAR